MPDILQIHFTTDSREEAVAISDELVRSKLAACVQISGPIESRYWWNGQVETTTEWLCTAKTTAGLYERVESQIRKIHSYDEPEILATAVTQGSESYINWVRESTQAA